MTLDPSNHRTYFTAANSVISVGWNLVNACRASFAMPANKKRRLLMTFSAKAVSAAIAATAAFFAVCGAAPASAQVTPTVLQTATSADGLLTLVLSSTNPSDAVGVDNTYTWTAINNSNITLTGVVLGSHWGDWCIGGSAVTFSCVAPPTGPTLISLAPSCGGQSPSEFPTNIAHFGVWCTPITGVTLAPAASVSGSITLRPGTGGPAFYGVYSRHDPVPGLANQVAIFDPVINYRGMVAPAPTDIQVTGHASDGAPPVGSAFTYAYQVKNSGPWGTFGGLVFVDTLPAALTYISSSVLTSVLAPDTGQPVAVTVQPCSAVGQTVMCPLIDLQNGGAFGQDTITITVAASSVAQQIVNTASVHTVLPQTDANLTNNSVTVTVTTR